MTTNCDHSWRPYRRVVRGPGGVLRATGRQCRLCGWLHARVIVRPRTRLDDLRVRSAFEQLEARLLATGGRPRWRD